jgi:hypothetical protein
MNRVVPVEKNEEYIVEVSGLRFEGEGVAKVERLFLYLFREL